MMTKTSLPGDDEPVQAFANCHVGIIETMRDLGGLPALLEAAHRARLISERIESFFNEVVRAHHREEEQELFTAVLASAAEGAEHAEAAAIILQLTAEHQDIEATLGRLIPAIKAAGKGLNVTDLNGLVTLYLAHARFEEQVFLPLAKTILGRNAKHMEALGLSLHIRHNADEIRRSFGVV